MTGFAWGNLYDPPTAKLFCTRGHPIDGPWTDAFIDDPKRPFELGSGYAGSSFTTRYLELR
ncbi:hypothetical protein V1517DRAFT_56424 [Lipomyces orientalis]|uniref:Uncharacterized protein n=1 Tax=Lipomyces orientalis TaxID=1233043 RepID=A0ACC3TDR4_9ASCO